MRRLVLVLALAVFSVSVVFGSVALGQTVIDPKDQCGGLRNAVAVQEDAELPVEAMPNEDRFPDEPAPFPGQGDEHAPLRDLAKENQCIIK